MLVVLVCTAAAASILFEIVAHHFADNYEIDWNNRGTAAVICATSQRSKPMLRI
ncbi:hypothetical protein [Rhizobium sp. BK251]|uniref:hypothetical protein n=1 Tax=Rhizobium sp. BK251 TaxID=2512125 RepID=UPI0010F34BE4|nr:hypothetical protein [Rhizobium sp. BK251]TCL73962.1 hypothetical protein EV286_103496 [Rhizobium sp. BK251]